MGGIICSTKPKVPKHQTENEAKSTNTVQKAPEVKAINSGSQATRVDFTSQYGLSSDKKVSDKTPSQSLAAKYEPLKAKNSVTGEVFVSKCGLSFDKKISDTIQSQAKVKDRLYEANGYLKSKPGSSSDQKNSGLTKSQIAAEWEFTNPTLFRLLTSKPESSSDKNSGSTKSQTAAKLELTKPTLSSAKEFPKLNPEPSSDKKNSGLTPSSTAAKYELTKTKSSAVSSDFSSKYGSSPYRKGLRTTEHQKAANHEPIDLKLYVVNNHMIFKREPSSDQKNPVPTKPTSFQDKKLGSRSFKAEEEKAFNLGLPGIGKVSNEPNSYKSDLKPFHTAKMTHFVVQESSKSKYLSPLSEKTPEKTFSETTISKTIKPTNFLAEKDMKLKSLPPSFEKALNKPQSEVPEHTKPLSQIYKSKWNIGSQYGVYPKETSTEAIKYKTEEEAAKITNFGEYRPESAKYMQAKSKSFDFKECMTFKHGIYKQKDTAEKSIEYKKEVKLESPGKTIKFLNDKSLKPNPSNTKILHESQSEAIEHPKVKPKILEIEQGVHGMILKKGTLDKAIDSKKEIKPEKTVSFLIEKGLKLDHFYPWPEAGEQKKIRSKIDSREEQLDEEIKKNQSESVKQLKIIKSKIFDFGEGMAFKYGIAPKEEVSEEGKPEKTVSFLIEKELKLSPINAQTCKIPHPELEEQKKTHVFEAEESVISNSELCSFESASYATYEEIKENQSEAAKQAKIKSMMIETEEGVAAFKHGIISKEKASKEGKPEKTVSFVIEKGSKLDSLDVQSTGGEQKKMKSKIDEVEETFLCKSELYSIDEISDEEIKQNQSDSAKQMKIKSNIFEVEALQHVLSFIEEISEESIEYKVEGVKMASFTTGEDIIIKCGLEEMVKLFFKDYVIVWHDPNVHSEENKRHKAQLEKFCEIQTFTEWEKASKYVKEAKAICHVLTSGTNGEPLVKEIWSSQSVLMIYIFCLNKDYHSTWAKNYSKVSCIEIRIQDVINQIEQNLLNWYKEASSLRINLPAFAPIFNNWDKSKINNLHRYLKVLPNFKNRLQAKADFITLSKAIYSDEINTAIIQDFESHYNEYRKEEILKWYTHESFLYKVTNNCLRIASSDSIQYCRLLLKDLEQAIKEQYSQKSKNFSGVLHRGAFLSQEEWSSLKANLGQEVEMHGFLSASKEKDVAWDFMKKDSNQKVFITILVPKGPNEEEQGFAEVEDFSNHPEEKEILFNVRSRFTVLEAEDPSTQGLSYRHLVLLYGAQGFRRFVTEKSPVQKFSIPNLQDISCSVFSCHSATKSIFFKSIANNFPNQDSLCESCLPKIYDLKKGPFLCLPAINNSRALNMKGVVVNYPIKLRPPFYGYKCCKCQSKKQKMYLKCTECSNERKEVWCISCLQGLSGCMKAGHAVVLESNPFEFWCEKMSDNELNHLKFQSKIVINEDVFQQAEMFSRCHQYQKSIKYYNLYIQQNEKDGDKSQLATCYNNLGTVYESQGDYKKALEYLSKALEIRRSLYGENHADVAASYSNIGSVEGSQGEFQKAGEHHVKALKIRKTVGGDNHHELGNSFNNIALVCYSMGKYQQALKFHSNALVKRKFDYGENHPEVAGSYNNIALVYTCQGKYKKALEYHSKALEIQKLVYGDNHPDVATSHNNIGNANMSQGEYSKALKDYSNALEIFKSVYKENHLSVAGSYNNLGLVYTSLRDYEKALEYYFKALEIRLETLHEGHPDVAISYSNIGGAYSRQGDWKKALEYLWEAREIRISIYGEDHAHTTSTNNQIEMIVNNLENKNNEYFMKIL